MNSVTINNYYIVNNKLIGSIGENNMGLIKGRFFSVEVTKQLDKVAYDELGTKYILGTLGTTPLGDVLKAELNKLTWERHTGNVLEKAIQIASLITTETSKPELESEKEYKTCRVAKYVWRILGRTIKLSVNQSKLNLNTELTII
ncbi:hypothetical protein OCT63_19865 [Vibrio sp. RW]|uniref:hypothetical protein n=1 Tax=Vibrio sp. RW TaxID=2998833 RepID=UPI0022CDBA65|nr:hypothetical protein [Vibrio sp. RW]MDA0146487.1 hypothetical protein [Vibrio sp. RW]